MGKGKFLLSTLGALLLWLILEGGALANQTNPEVNLKISLHHVVIKATGDNQLFITEAIQVKNGGSSTYSDIIKMNLPTGYTNFQAGEGLDSATLQLGEREVSFKAIIPPGEKTFSWTYYLPGQNNQFILDRTIQYPTENLVLLSISGGLVVNDPGLVKGRSGTLNGVKYQEYFRTNLTPGQFISTTISYNPTEVTNFPDSNGRKPFHTPEHIARWKSSPLGNTDPHLWLIFIALAGLGSLSLIIYHQRRKRERFFKGNNLAKYDSILESLTARQNYLVEKIAQLDTMFAQGNLAEEEYQRERDFLKKNLIKVTWQIKSLEEED